MRNLSFIILLLFATNLFCQKILIKDIKTKKPIPYAIVMLDTTGFYSNKKGVFNFKNKSFDNIEIKHISYESLKLNHSEVTDTLFLEPKTNKLGEVKIMNFEYLKRKKLRKPANFFNSIFKDNSEIVTCLKPKKQKIKNAYLVKLVFEISKRKELTKVDEFEKIMMDVRLNFYVNNQLKPKKPIKSILFEDLKLKKIIENNYTLKLNIKNNSVKIPDNGICIGLEHIKFKNDPNSFFVSFENVKNKSRFFEAKTLLNYPLNGKGYKSAKELDPKGFEQFNLENPVLLPEMIIYYD